MLNEDTFSRFSREAQLFNGFRATILVNRTNQDFFLPSTHFYTVVHKSTLSYVLILSPKEAAVLIDAKLYDTEYKNEQGDFYSELTEAEAVDMMNEECILFDTKYGVGKVVGGKTELQKFIKPV